MNTSTTIVRAAALAGMLATVGSASASGPKESARRTSSIVPLSFVAAKGSGNTATRFMACGAGYGLHVTGSEAVLALPSRHATLDRGKPVLASKVAARDSAPAILRMRLVGANAAAVGTAVDPLPGTVNIMSGPRQQWRTGVKSYGKVRFASVYPGIDLVYYGTQPSAGGMCEVEYDFVVRPDADPSSVRLAFEGAEAIRNENGDLITQTSAGPVRWHRPYVYQTVNGSRRQVACEWKIEDGRASARTRTNVRLALGRYDRSRTLVIDPVLSYSTYLGGCLDDQAYATAVDAGGAIYVAGSTCSPMFPAVNAAQPTIGGSDDAFVAKFSSDGQTLLYSTYLGGSGSDEAYAMSIDAAGSVYVTGRTGSPNFPVLNGFQPANAGSEDAFVAKLSSAGALVYSTYLGGSNCEHGYSIAVNAKGNVSVVGGTMSTDFPLYRALQSTPGGGADAFVAVVNATGTALLYGSYLGGTGNESATATAWDSARALYVSGSTNSGNFPTSAGSFQPTFGGVVDAYVTKLTGNPLTTIWTTYVGGSGPDIALAGTVAPTGEYHVAGITLSPDFPVYSAAQDLPAGSFDGYVTKLTADGSGVGYSTLVGGSDYDQILGIGLDGAGSAHVTGFTYSPDYPTVSPVQGHRVGVSDAFVSKIAADGSQFPFSTYLNGTGDAWGHGVAVGATGAIVVAGGTSSKNFPVSSPYQSQNRGYSNAFVTVVNTAVASPTYSYALDRTSSSGSVVALRGYLYRSSDNSMVAGKSLSFSIDDTPVGSAVTDADGRATLNWTVTAGAASRAILVTWAGDADYAASSDTGTLTVSGYAVTIYTYGRSAKVGQVSELKGLLRKLSDLSLIVGRTVSFSVDGTSVGSGTTGANGYASYFWTVPVGTSIGAHTVRADFAGDATYAAGTGTGSVTILAP